MVHVLYLRIQLWTSVKDINICRLIFWLRCRLLILCLTSLYQKRKRSSNKATYWWQRERNRAEEARHKKKMSKKAKGSKETETQKSKAARLFIMKLIMCFLCLYFIDNMRNKAQFSKNWKIS